MKTNEQARSLLEALGKMQKQGRAADLPCPRCGQAKMSPIPVKNSLSRYAKVYICDDCGMDEALMDFAGVPPLPLQEWGMIKAFD